MSTLIGSHRSQLSFKMGVWDYILIHEGQICSSALNLSLFKHIYKCSSITMLKNIVHMQMVLQKRTQIKHQREHRERRLRVSRPLAAMELGLGLGYGARPRP